LGSIRAFPKTDLYDWLGPLIGRNVTFSQLEKAVGSITRNYRDRGYVAATALLPQQSFTGGRIEVMVYEGDLDPDRPVRFESKEGLRLNTEWAARIVKNAIGDEPIQQDSLERGLLMLQEIPGVSATVDLEPGLTQGTVRAAVVASEGKPVEGSLGANNMGAKSTGQNASSAEVRFNNALGQGEQLGFTYKPSEKKGQESYSLVSSIPVGDYGWRLGLNANHVTYRVDSDEDTQARGESDDITLTLRYPIQRSRALNQSLSVDLTAKRMSDYVNNETISEKSMSSVGATYSFDRTDLSTGNSLYGSVGLNLGKLDLTKNREAYEADQDGPKTHGGFSKTLINAGSSIRLPYNFILGISGSAQMASKNLNTSEKFGLGGPFGVRGYPVGEASGDEGWRISTELKRSLFTSARWGSVGPMLFYDTGSVTRYKRPDGIIEEDQTNSYRLSGWGAGIFASKPNAYDFRLMWATKLGSNPGQRLDDEDRLIDNDGTNSKSRLWATFTYSF
jgi:hemolysin activation/secretion protein